MRKSIFTLLAVLFTSVLVAQVSSDLVIKKGADLEPNGLEDDAIWSMIEPVAITNVFNYEEPTVESYFKLFYTDEYIYLLIKVDDDVHFPAWIAEDTKNEWKYDKVEVYFDVNNVLKDGKGPAYTDGYMAPGHYQMAPALKEDTYGVPHEPKNVIYGSLSELVTIAYTLKEDNSGYVMEYRFPMYGFTNDQDAPLDVNAFMALPQGLGFDVLVVDNDNDGKGRKRAVWKNMGPDEPYTNMDACGVVTFSPEVISGINNPRIPEGRVYPNPVQDILTIDGDFDQVILTNLAGQQVKVAATSHKLDVSDMATGVYIMKTVREGIVNSISKITKE